MTAKVRGYCYRGREKSNKSKKSEPGRKALAFCLSGGRRKPRFHRRVDNAGFRGRIGRERAGKVTKRQKKGLNGTSISGINTRIMRATPLLAAMNTNHHKQHE